MGIAAMVIGIVSALLGFIPLCNYFAVIPALVGIVLGIVDVVTKGKNQQPRGMGIAGIVLNGLAIGLILVWTMVIAAGGAAARQEAQRQLQIQRDAQRIQINTPGVSITTGTPPAPAGGGSGGGK